MAQNFTDIYSRLLLRAPVGPALAQDFIRDAFNQLCERREWSWLMRQSSFFPRVFDQTGTVDLTGNSPVITATGTNFLPSYAGLQFRAMGNPSAYSTYTILAVPSATSLILDRPWSGPTASARPFQIFQAYFPVPDDFQYFYSLISTTNNYRLHTNVQQNQLDTVDAQRVQIGNSYCASFFDYTRTAAGTVNPVEQVRGFGPSPVSGTLYGFSYPAPLTYVIYVLQGGTPASGLLQIEWFTTATPAAIVTLAVTNNAPIDLSNGVQVYFPEAAYTTADRFIITATPSQSSATGRARYELWPRPINLPYEYPYLYVSKPAELSELNPTLPEPIARRSDVLLEMALGNCARYPGSPTDANPYFNPTLALQHDSRAERMIYDLELKDDSTALKDLIYTRLAWAPAPWLDGNWLQRHAVYPY